MKIRPLSAAVLLALSSLAMSAQADDVRRPYIVQLTDKPIASYTGEISGLPATQPPAGQRLDLNAAPVQLYSGYLQQRQAAVRAAVGGAPVLHQYSIVLNGFSAMLTDAEVRALQARGDVQSVAPDEPRELTTTYTPDFLELDKPGGAWSKLGGVTQAGEDVIVGIVDGGVWPEQLSYADRVDSNGKPTFDPSGTLAYDAPPARWKGECQTGEGFTQAHCNNKLIGAQYFDATYRSQNRTTHWSDFRSSPRDSIARDAGEGGHGTHTSTTAAGNAGVDAIVSGVNVGTRSGMAPRARIASYKVCWTFLDNTVAAGRRNACYVGDSVAAIEKAVADGVHVINFSISGGLSITDSVEQAFFNASNAGVIAVASAGNDGPGNQVAHVSPWHTTVAASTHNRELQAEIELGNGQKFTGASMNNTPLPAAPLITAEEAALPGANASRVSLCYSGSFNGGPALLDPAKVAGKIVICTRGENDRVDKSRAVLEAGGVGMIMVDNGSGLVAEPHSVPTVHVTAAQGATIRAYAASANATAAIGKFVIGRSSVPAPMLAAFSSRGPNRYDANVLKPDLTAPGVDILAGGTPSLTPDEHAGIIDGSFVPPAPTVAMQGTSMSAPHVAGLSALLRQKYPDWSPAMIKSALMTTATDTVPDAQTGNLRGNMPFGQGAGHVNPNAAMDPGLVYDITQADYRKYMCGQGIASQCAGGQIASHDLNLPSITVGNVPGTISVKRSVTNVADRASTYTAQISVPGFNATVTPSTLTLGAGETKQFTVQLTRTSAQENAWQFGQLVWNDGTHTVRSPVVARAGKPITAPGAIYSDRPAGSRVMGISTGFSGKMSAQVGGLKEFTRTPVTLAQARVGSLTTIESMRAACVNGAQGTHMTPVTITSSSMAAQFQLFTRDTSGGEADDLDLLLVNSANTLVAYSANEGSNESITLMGPAPGNYRLCTLAYATAGGQPATFGLHSVVVNTSDKGGNLKALVPAQVYAGGTASVPVSWSGLANGKRFLGAVRLLDSGGQVATTTAVLVETDNPIPLPEGQMRASLRVGTD